MTLDKMIVSERDNCEKALDDILASYEQAMDTRTEKDVFRGMVVANLQSIEMKGGNEMTAMMLAAAFMRLIKAKREMGFAE